MEKTQLLTKEKLKTHLQYDLWKYLVLAVGAFMAWDLIYTQTAYRSPQDKRIDIYVMSATVTDNLMEEFFTPIWKETVPDMELVEGVTMLPTGGADDYYAQMALTTRLYAAEGDIYFLPADTFKSCAIQGTFLYLDELVESGELDISNLDVSSARLTIVNEETGTAETHLCGVPTDELFGFMEGLQYDNRGGVVAIAVNNGNDDNVIPFFNALIQAGRGEKPEWLREAENANP